MVCEGVGSLFTRKDGRYFIYLPKALVEDSAFPMGMGKVMVSFDPKSRVKQLKIEIEVGEKNRK